MVIEEAVHIRGTRESVWQVIADIENLPGVLTGVVQIEMLERPSGGLVGLKWRETRMLFDKPAAVDRWITEAVENESYTVRAEDGGFEFVTTRRLTPDGKGTRLTESHETRPRGVIAWVMAIPMRLFFRGVIRKVLVQDLNEIKTAVEGKGANPNSPQQD